MIPALGALLLWLSSPPRYELVGRVVPETQASISLHGAVSPFNASTLTDARGRFRFRDLLPGPYTVVVFVPGRGEMRETVEVAPSLADRRRRVAVTLELRDARIVSGAARRRNIVSARELSIPQAARREYDQAQSKLGRRDVAGAVRHLERAVELAPQFAAAWNNLGTIAYQTRDYDKAETYFRKSLDADSAAYEPLVNLGGVLVTVGRAEEALPYNLHAALARPEDALANSQLGLNYFQLGKLDLAEKYLKVSIGLDPAHFSHPQLPLAEIYLRRQEPGAAAAVLEDFLRRHPDWRDAEKVRAAIAGLRDR